jgi:hypothetical protein
VQSVIAACWHEDPKKRPSAKQLVQALETMERDVQVHFVLELSCHSVCMHAFLCVCVGEASA